MSSLAQFCVNVAALVEQFESIKAEIEVMPSSTPTQLQEIMKAVKVMAETEKPLVALADSISVLYNNTSASVADAIEMFDKQVNTLRNVLRTPPPQDKKIAVVNTEMTYAAMVQSPKPPPIPAKTIDEKLVLHEPATKRYEIASGVTISAYPICGADSCKTFPGWFCFNSEDERFYISINGYVIGAVTTDILDGSILPYKFHEFRQSGNRQTPPKESNFYIVAADYPGSKDRRILTNRAIYVPAAEIPKPHEKFVYRIGSKTHLRDDLDHMQKSDYRMLNDQAGNFLLCLIAAAAKMEKK